MSDDEDDDVAEDRRARRRVLHARRRILRWLRAGPRTGTAVAAKMREPLPDVLHAFEMAEQAGLVTVTGSGLWVLTTEGRVVADRHEAQRLAGIARRTTTESTTTDERETTAMKIRKMKKMNAHPEQTEPTMTAAQVQAERDRLRESVHGPGATARAALDGDPVLIERLDKAMADGLEVSLENVPRFRRGAEVERLVTEWEEAHQGGPCQWCGTATARRGREVVRYIPGADTDESHQWATYGTATCCRWCRDLLGERGEDGLRSVVFRAAASVRPSTFQHIEAWTPFWSELTAERQAEVRKAGRGAPWAHINVEHCRALAADLLQFGSEFATTDAAVEHVRIPGIESRAWKPGETPMHSGTKFVLVGRAASDSYRREAEAWAARRAKEAGKAAAYEAKVRKNQAERDAMIDAMTPGEYDAWVAKQALFVGSGR